LGKKVNIKVLFSEKSIFVPTCLLILGGISYGSIFSANKMAIEAGFPFMAYTFWQILISAAILLLLSIITRQLPKINFRNIRVFSLVAVTGLLGPLLVITSVATKLPPGVITLGAGLIPVVTYILALSVKADRIRALSIGGVLVGFGSVLLIILPSESLPIQGSWIWVIFLLLMPFSASLNNVFGAMLRPSEEGSIPMTAGMMIIAAILLFIISWSYDGLYSITEAGLEGIIAVLWASAAVTITYTCFFEIIRRASGLFFAQINYLIVAAGLFWAWIIFGESLSSWVWGAVALLILSLTLMNIGMAKSLKK
tara:strand:+ start:65 stop:997 length:933 start_codon:yes stop_codon:yes gene_type:complete